MVTGDSQTSHAPERSTSSTRRGRRKVVALLLGLAVLVGAMAWTVHWWTNPDVLERAGLEYFVAAPQPVERATLHTTLTYPPSAGDGSVVTLREVHPRLVRNSADALVTFSICRDGEPFISVSGPLESHCAVVVPVEKGTLLDHRPDSDEFLVMTVSPQRRGRTVVDRVLIRYEIETLGLVRRGDRVLEGQMGVRAR